MIALWFWMSLCSTDVLALWDTYSWCWPSPELACRVLQTVEINNIGGGRIYVMRMRKGRMVKRREEKRRKEKRREEKRRKEKRRKDKRREEKRRKEKRREEDGRRKSKDGISWHEQITSSLVHRHRRQIGWGVYSKHAQKNILWSHYPATPSKTYIQCASVRS